MVSEALADRACIAGNLTLAAACLLALNLAFGMGLWKAMREHRRQVALQLAMDRCTGQDAQALRDTLRSVESWNTRIRGLRAALVGSTIAPQAKPPLLAALTASVVAQDLRLRAWTARQALALVPAGCGIAGFLRAPLPRLDYRRPPPDAVGLQALVWLEQPRAFELGGRTLYRRTDAQVERSATSWQARWGRFRPSLD